MNFRQWLREYSKDMDGTPSIYGLAEDTWNSCKDEMLKIINEHQFYSYADKIELIENIENEL